MGSFPNDIAEELGWAVSDVSGHRAMILDLRGNPGGLIDAVDATAGIFLPPGTLVVSGTGRYHFLGSRRFTASGDAQVRYKGSQVGYALLDIEKKLKQEQFLLQQAQQQKNQEGLVREKEQTIKQSKGISI